jgi:hypothetical protein
MDTRLIQRKRLREDSFHLCNTSLVTDKEASYFANLIARLGKEPRRKKFYVSLPPDDLSNKRRMCQFVIIWSSLLVSRKNKHFCPQKQRPPWSFLEES